MVKSKYKRASIWTAPFKSHHISFTMSESSVITPESESIDIIRYASLDDENGKHYLSSPLDPKTRLDVVRKQLTEDGIMTDKELFEGKGSSICPRKVESSLTLDRMLRVLSIHLLPVVDFQANDEVL
jgi:hypothetical protein